MSLKILWHSNSPTVATGYAIQTRRFAPRIKRALGHDVAISAFYGLEGSMLHWLEDIPIYPRGYHPFGQDIMSTHAKYYNADIVLTLMDAWVVQPDMMLPGTRWCAWFPIDSEPVPRAVERHVVQAYERIVMSRFGEEMMRAAGMDCSYVPHGVETGVYAPSDQATARREMGLPEDAFIVGMVAANKGAPSRKAFMPQLRAFSVFKEAHPDQDIRLYLHTTKGDHGEYGGENLPEFLEFLGLTHAEMGSVDAGWADVIFCSQYLNILQYTDQHMTNVYNALDLLMSVSMGEGFGVPILEAESCGTPVLVGDWTAMSELCWAGWKVPKSAAEPIWMGQAAWQFYPHWQAIVEQLETAYDALSNEKYAKKMRMKARNGALDYDCDRITEQYWSPVLERIEERVNGEKRSMHALPTDFVLAGNPDGDAA